MRWKILVKGLGGTAPGLRIHPTKMALRLKDKIMNKDENYEQFSALMRDNRTGKNSFIDII